jgi:hypothetical protein
MTNQPKKASEENGKEYLRGRLIDVESAFVLKLKQKMAAITHDGTAGDATEDAWIDLLKDYLPARYRVAKAFAVDHLGHTTDQLDCLIYDAHFTPSLFGEHNNLYVPVEAVYATFEVKQSIDAGDIAYAGKKAASLRALVRTSADLRDARGATGPKELLPIIGGLFAMNASWSDGLGETFIQNLDALQDDEVLDMVITAESGFCDRVNADDISIFTGEGALIRGLFRLLRALRSKHTVPAIEWERYEEVFE